MFLRGTTLRAAILGCLEPDLESLIPKRLAEDKKSHQNSQEIDEFKQVVGGLFPWYLIRSRILLGEIKDLEIPFQEVEQRSQKARSQRYRQNDSLPFESARVCFESLAFKKPCNPSEEISIIERLFDNKYKLSLQDHLSAVRAAYRLEHLSEIRNQLEQSCYEIVMSLSNEGPETKAENYIALARAVLPVSSADAAAYFDCAIEAVSKFGDELVQRWEAVVAIARRSAEGKRSSPEIAYRFIRCAELVGESVAREKHWSRNEAIQVCAKLCPSSAFAALSRWRDRDVVRWFENQLSALAHEAVSSKIIAPSVGWSLSAFSWDYQFDKFAALCIETESDETCRQYILDTAVRDIRLNDASESSWQTLKQVTERFSLKNKEIQKVLAFYAQKSRANYTEEASQQPRIIESEEAQNIDWEEIFADLDLTKTTGLNTALNKFDAIHYSPLPDAF